MNKIYHPIYRQTSPKLTNILIYLDLIFNVKFTNTNNIPIDGEKS